MDARHRGIDHLQRLDHIDVPIKEQVDIRRTAARDRANGLKTRHAIDGLLDGPRDCHFHLLDGHYAVIDSDFDQRKVRRRENGHRQLECFIDSNDAQNDNEEDDGLVVARKPVVF